MERLATGDPALWRCRNCGIEFDVPEGKQGIIFSHHRNRYCMHAQSDSQAARKQSQLLMAPAVD